MGEDKGGSGGTVEAELRSVGGETDWPWVVAVTVVRTDGFDRAGLADGLERRGEGEEKGEIKEGMPKLWA